jgi:hypothetical protein
MSHVLIQSRHGLAVEAEATRTAGFRRGSGSAEATAARADARRITVGLDRACDTGCLVVESSRARRPAPASRKTPRAGAQRSIATLLAMLASVRSSAFLAYAEPAPARTPSRPPRCTLALGGREGVWAGSARTKSALASAPPNRGACWPGSRPSLAREKPRIGASVGCRGPLRPGDRRLRARPAGQTTGSCARAQPPFPDNHLAAAQASPLATHRSTATPDGSLNCSTAG